MWQALEAMGVCLVSCSGTFEAQAVTRFARDVYRTTMYYAAITDKPSIAKDAVFRSAVCLARGIQYGNRYLTDSANR